MNSFIDQQSSPTSSVTTASLAGVVQPPAQSSPSNYMMATPDKMLTTVTEGTENSYGTTHTTEESNHNVYQQNGTSYDENNNHVNGTFSPSRPTTGITPPRPPPVAPPAPPPLPGGTTGLAPLQFPLQAKISKTAGSFSMAVRCSSVLSWPLPSIHFMHVFPVSCNHPYTTLRSLLSYSTVVLVATLSQCSFLFQRVSSFFLFSLCICACWLVCVLTDTCITRAVSRPHHRRRCATKRSKHILSYDTLLSHSTNFLRKKRHHLTYTNKASSNAHFSFIFHFLPSFLR